VTVHSSTASVGAAAPDFRLVDQHGVEFHLADEVSAGPLVLVFLRGFS
jgi:peroxiredoxin